jgi:hypothetical protein
MKKYIIFALFIFIGTFLFAQGNYSASEIEKASKITNQMKNTLQLTQAQLSEIQTVNLEVVRRMDELVKSNADDALLTSRIQAINTYRDKEFQRILTKSQLSVLVSDPNGRTCKR